MSRSSANVRHNGDRVLLTIDGRSWELPWQAALELSRMLMGAARQCEELAVANRLIADQALLIRAGAPFALSNHPKIRDAARTEAQWDSQLRRYIPLPPWRRPVEFGVPSVTQEPPK